MNTPPIKQSTTATVELLPHFGEDGRFHQIVVIKERFSIYPGTAPARVGGAEVRIIDVPWDEDAPEAGNTRLPSEHYFDKPGTDVIVAGDAVAPGKPVGELDVSVRVGPLYKALRVFGQRVWYRGMSGMTLTPPEPFERVPLRWDLAFGGYDAGDETRAPLEEPRNPIGRGLAADPATLEHLPGPQIEDPEHPIRTHRTRPPPAGVACIAPHWSPRREYAGTYDADWAEQRMPLPPLDFDSRFNHCAVSELVSSSPLRGGERVELVGLSSGGPMAFDLPKLAFSVGSYVDRRLQMHRTKLDTVLFDMQDMAVDLTFRAQVPIPRPARRLSFVQIVEQRVLS